MIRQLLPAGLASCGLFAAACLTTGGNDEVERTSHSHDDVGEVCADEDDCTGDTYCHEDREQRILDGICVADCSKDADCEKPGSVCADGLCAPGCSHGGLCGSGMVCSEAGHCDAAENVPVCVGRPPACESYSEEECGAVSGCAVVGACEGEGMYVESRCGGAATDTECFGIPGCHWDNSLSGFCSARPQPCAALANKRCAEVPNCAWRSLGCGGEATPCSEYDLDGCPAELDCAVLFPDEESEFLASLGPAKQARPPLSARDAGPSPDGPGALDASAEPARDTPLDLPMLAPERYSSIVTAQTMSCGIRQEDSTLDCWGNEVPPVPSGVAFKSVALGSSAVCGIRLDDDQLLCWGNDELVAKTPDVAVAQVSVGTRHACVILEPSGELSCWGANDVGQTDAPAGSFVQLESYLDLNCAVRADTHEAACWGANGHGSAEPPTGVAFLEVRTHINIACGRRESDSKVECWGWDDVVKDLPPPAERLSSFSLAGSYACGILESDGTSLCWGETNGRGGIPAGTPLKQLSARTGHTCGLKADGTMQCWGSLSAVTMPPPGDQYLSLSVSPDFAQRLCAVKATDQRLYCWNSDIGTPMSESELSLPATGNGHECAIRVSDGEAECFGLDYSGETVPPAGEAFVKLAAAEEISCGLQADGAVLCWGNDLSGQASPPAGSRFIDIAAGNFMACGIHSDDGRIECWGAPTFDTDALPEGVAFTQLSMNQYDACGLVDDGSIQCWAGNTLKIPEDWAGTAFSSLSLGSSHLCAIREADGRVQCVGLELDDWGQTIPDVEFDSLASGLGFTCGIETETKRLRCWGSILL